MISMHEKKWYLNVQQTIKSWRKIGNTQILTFITEATSRFSIWHEMYWETHWGKNIEKVRTCTGHESFKGNVYTILFIFKAGDGNLLPSQSYWVSLRITCGGSKAKGKRKFFIHQAWSNWQSGENTLIGFLHGATSLGCELLFRLTEEGLTAFSKEHYAYVQKQYKQLIGTRCVHINWPSVALLHKRLFTASQLLFGLIQVSQPGVSSHTWQIQKERQI